MMNGKSNKILKAENHLGIDELPPIMGYVTDSVGWTNQEPEKDETRID